MTALASVFSFARRLILIMLLNEVESVDTWSVIFESLSKGFASASNHGIVTLSVHSRLFPECVRLKKVMRHD